MTSPTMLQRHIIIAAFFAFSRIISVAGQATTSSVNPLNAFIGGVQSGAGAIKSAASAEASQTSSSSSSSSSSSASTSPSTTPPPAPATTTSAAAAHHGLSSGALAGIVIGSIVAAALILGILIGCCCCLMRRRHHQNKAESIHDEEKKVLQPTNPGRQYAPVAQHTSNVSFPANSHSTAPLMGASALPHGHSPAPSLSQHPAIRQGGNPFAPVPPAPRRSGLNSSHGLPEGAVAAAGAGAAAYGVHKHGEQQCLRDRSRSASRPRLGLPVVTVGTGAVAHGVHESEEKQRLRDRSRSKSRPRSETSIGATGLPTQNDADRPPTPFGLTGLSQPYEDIRSPNKGTSGTGQIATGPPWSEVRQQYNSGQPHTDGNGHPYGGIGSPYDDMHVHVLQTDAPSRELRHSLHNKNAPFPAGTFNDPTHPTYRNSRGYSTPPEVPSRSPNRGTRESQTLDGSPHSSLSVTTPSWTSDEQYTTQSDPYQPAHPHPRSAPWEQNQGRYSGTPPTSATMSTNTMTAPPIPWEDSGYQNRRKSHSPRASRNSNAFIGNEGRRSSRSPGATSINGQPRRLRFEDLQPGNDESHANRNAHDSFDAQDHARWSQGVGEAL